MNWGYGILIVIILFVVGMSSMVFISMQQTNEMLDENYYVEEKKYQSLIDAQTALKSIQEQELLVQNGQEVKVQLPVNSFGDISDASINFIKPDNQKLDVEMKLLPDDSGRFLISKTNLVKGVYKVRVKWSNEGQLYYSDDEFIVL
jgi:hypothetical protein